MSNVDAQARAVQMFERSRAGLQPMSCAEIAAELDVSARTVKRWKAAWKKGDLGDSPPPPEPASQPASQDDEVDLLEADAAPPELDEFWRVEYVNAKNEERKASARNHGQVALGWAKHAATAYESYIKFRKPPKAPEASLTEDELIERVIAAVEALPPRGREAIINRVESWGGKLRVVGGRES